MAITGNFGQAGVFFIDDRAFRGALNRYVAGMSTDEAKKAILRRASAVVAYNVRRLDYPKSQIYDREYGEKYHYFYSGKGEGRKKVKIFKGNLLRSTKYYFTKYKEYEIGPKVIRTKLPDEVGKTLRNASGFYASMVFGSAEKYRQYILEPELNGQDVFNALLDSFRNFHQRQARANGLQP